MSTGQPPCSFGAPGPRGARSTSLLAALGISRVARLTGLDRTGVEVAVAVRPEGHVLQLSNGKGRTFALARATAISEAAELWAAERVEASELIFGSTRGLAKRRDTVLISPEQLASDGSLVAPRLSGPDTILAWRRGVELGSGRPALVPAHAVHCPPPGSPSLGPAALSWTSNGSAAHPRRAAALRHALLELCERHQLEATLPDGFTPKAIRRRRLDPRSLAAAAPRAGALLGAISAKGLTLELLDLTPSAAGHSRATEKKARLGAAGVGLPLGGALLFDEDGPVPLAAGYACGLTRDQALCGSILEAAQSRLTEIHGAREDAGEGPPRAWRQLLRWIERSPKTDAVRMPTRADGADGVAVARILRRLARAGHPQAIAVELSPPGFPLTIVKVVIPGLARSRLL
ncbi:MAG: YcaO-like family protein [Deltaproteobacteria bacterium]